MKLVAEMEMVASLPDPCSDYDQAFHVYDRDVHYGAPVMIMMI